MAFFYDDTRIAIGRGDSGFNPARYNAVNCYMTHFENSLFLNFMMENGTPLEKNQAAKELTIAERKMKYWRMQPHFDQTIALKECQRAKRKWK